MIIAPYRDNLKQIVILNPKGGCGKTTLATNLACHLALRGSRPMLIDNDPRGYSTRWLETRPEGSLTIAGVSSDASSEIARHRLQRIPRQIDTVIVDTPAAVSQREIRQLTHNADCILVPVLPSAFDVHATTRFVADLLVLTDFERPIAVVANRTRQNTRSLQLLLRTLASFETPTIAVLRDSQNFVHAANVGLGICELPYYKAQKDLEQFAKIVGWLDQLTLQRSRAGFLAALRRRKQLSGNGVPARLDLG
jgi:chromosome partitioning protein